VLLHSNDFYLEEEDGDIGMQFFDMIQIEKCYIWSDTGLKQIFNGFETIFKMLYQKYVLELLQGEGNEYLNYSNRYMCHY
jgi:hypothetical protein